MTQAAAPQKRWLIAHQKEGPLCGPSLALSHGAVKLYSNMYWMPADSV
jgi:hypothetical protein